MVRTVVSATCCDHPRCVVDDPLSDVINHAGVGKLEPFVELRKSELMTIWLDRRPAGIQTIDWST